MVPFAGASELHFRLARGLDLINNWNAGLYGRYPLSDVLSVMLRQVEARNAVLYRFGSNRLETVAAARHSLDQAKPKVSSGNMLKYVQKYHAAKIEPGRIFRLSELQTEPDFYQTATQREWAAQHDLVENHLIILSASEGQYDVIEIAYALLPEDCPEFPFSLLSTALANGWENRVSGLVSRQVRNFGRGRSTGPLQETDILGPYNPAGLTRAERRICQLLVGGDTAKDIADTLNLSVATIRTHLHNTYAKTGADGQVQLVALIAAGMGRSE
ncbi:helix-turn-helix transcriptional regulator [Antarctobacter sp.]|uniref:helix-turn-helix transcriptional regulator n=1 Tax=Antarctobacter sp. TaxID=1872577 RepID=UPI003A8D0FFD